jgi:uncharacterized membrane protein
MAEEKPAPPAGGGGGGGKNIGMAVLCYFGILVLIPLLTEAKNDPFVKFHIKQGLVLLIAYVVSGFVWAIPFIGWVVDSIVWIFLFVCFVMGIINASSGKEAPLPLIGQLGEKINI